MTTLQVDVGDEQCAIVLASTRLILPFGATMLTRTELTSDPPQPEELTNAIGVVVDHLDDLLREIPDAGAADIVEVRGAAMTAIAAVDVGVTAELPYRLARDAAEDVFRTMATETSRDRARNPGLPVDLVGTIVAACCIVVALIRHLRLDAVVIETPAEEDR